MKKLLLLFIIVFCHNIFGADTAEVINIKESETLQIFAYPEYIEGITEIQSISISYRVYGTINTEKGKMEIGNSINISKLNKNNYDESKKLANTQNFDLQYFSEYTTTDSIEIIKSILGSRENLPLEGDINLTAGIIDTNFSGENNGFLFKYQGADLFKSVLDENSNTVKEKVIDLNNINGYLTTQAGSGYNVSRVRNGDYFCIEIPVIVSDVVKKENLTHFAEIEVVIVDSSGNVSNFKTIVKYTGNTFTVANDEKMILITESSNENKYEFGCGTIEGSNYANQKVTSGADNNGYKVYSLDHGISSVIKVFGVNVVADNTTVAAINDIFDVEISEGGITTSTPMAFECDTNKQMTLKIFKADLFYVVNESERIKVASTDIFVYILKTEFVLSPVLKYYSPKYMKYIDKSGAARYLGINKLYYGNSSEDTKISYNSNFGAMEVKLKDVAEIDTLLKYKLTLEKLSEYKNSNMGTSSIYLMTQDMTGFINKIDNYTDYYYIAGDETSAVFRIAGKYITKDIDERIVIKEEDVETNKKRITIDGVRFNGSEVKQNEVKLTIPTEIVMKLSTGTVTIKDINLSYIYKKNYILSYSTEGQKKTVRWSEFKFNRETETGNNDAKGVLDTEISKTYDNSATGDDTVKNIGKSYEIQDKLDTTNYISNNLFLPVFNLQQGTKIGFQAVINGTYIEFPIGETKILTDENINRIFYVKTTRNGNFFENETTKKNEPVIDSGYLSKIEVTTQGDDAYYHFNMNNLKDNKNNTDVLANNALLKIDTENKKVVFADSTLNKENIKEIVFDTGGIVAITNGSITFKDNIDKGKIDLYLLEEIPHIYKEVWCEDNSDIQNITKIISQYTINRVKLSLNDIYIKNSNGNNLYKKEIVMIGRYYKNSIIYICDNAKSEIIAENNFLNAKRLINFDAARDKMLASGKYTVRSIQKFFTSLNGVEGDKNAEEHKAIISADEYGILTETNVTSTASALLPEYFDLLKAESNRNMPIYFTYPKATGTNKDGVYTGKDNYHYNKADTVTVPFAITFLKRNTYTYKPYEIEEITYNKPTENIENYRAVVKIKYNSQKKVVSVSESENFLYDVLYYMKIKPSENNPEVSINKYFPVDYSLNLGIDFLDGAGEQDMTKNIKSKAMVLSKTGNELSVFNILGKTEKIGKVEEAAAETMEEDVNVFYNSVWNSEGKKVYPLGSDNKEAESLGNNFYSSDKYILELPAEAGKYLERSVSANQFKIVLKPINRKTVSGEPKFSPVKEEDPLSIGGVENFIGNMTADYEKDVLTSAKPVYVLPEMNVKISANERVTLKKRFDISVVIDFRQDEKFDILTKKYGEKTNISSKMVINKKNNGEYEIIETKNENGEIISLKVDKNIENGASNYYAYIAPKIGLKNITVRKEFKDNSGNTKSEELLNIDCSIFTQENTPLLNGIVNEKTIDGKKSNTLFETYKITAKDMSAARLYFEGGKWTEKDSGNGLLWKLRNNKADYPGIRDIEIKNRGEKVYEIILRGIEASTKIYGEKLIINASGTLELSDRAGDTKDYLITEDVTRELKIDIPKLRKEMNK